jgi:nucleotide-binding universal stress UspA family protein
MATFKHILAATDFSDASRRALEVARSLARETGAELTVVNTCEMPAFIDFGVTADVVTPLADAAEAKLDELLRAVRADCPGAKGVVRVGVAWEQILVVAAEVGADVVVMGTHGRRGIAHAILGSVAERVVRLSDVPVLTVRSRPAA